MGDVYLANNHHMLGTDDTHGLLISSQYPKKVEKTRKDAEGFKPEPDEALSCLSTVESILSA